MSFSKWPSPKDPDDNLDYAIDWSARLEDGETIVESDFVVTTGEVVIGNMEVREGKTVVWLSGGLEGETAYIQNRILTSAGRQWDRTVGLKIKSQ